MIQKKNREAGVWYNVKLKGKIEKCVFWRGILNDRVEHLKII